MRPKNGKQDYFLSKLKENGLIESEVFAVTYDELNSQVEIGQANTTGLVLHASNAWEINLTKVELYALFSLPYKRIYFSSPTSAIDK